MEGRKEPKKSVVWIKEPTAYTGVMGYTFTCQVYQGFHLDRTLTGAGVTTIEAIQESYNKSVKKGFEVRLPDGYKVNSSDNTIIKIN